VISPAGTAHGPPSTWRARSHSRGGSGPIDTGDDGLDITSCEDRRGRRSAMGKGSTGAAAGGGAIYGLGIFDALF